MSNELANEAVGAINRLAAALSPPSNVMLKDSSGLIVENLSAAVVGATAGLFAIAKAINNLADAVRINDSEEEVTEPTPKQ